MRLLLAFLLSAVLLGPRGGQAQGRPTPTAPASSGRGAALPDSVQLDHLRDQITQQAEAGHFALAQRALHQADSLARRSGQLRLQVGAALSAGYLANALGDYPQGLARYQQALVLARQLGSYPRQVRALVRLGTTSGQADDLPAAARYLQQALALARQHQLRTPAADALGELANLADRQHQPTQALAYNAQALAIYQADQNWGQYYIGLLNQGIHLKNLGRYAEAEAAERRVLAYAQQQHDEYLQGYVYLNLPNALLPQHRAAEAEAYAQRALVWLRRVPQPNGFHDTYDVLSRVKEQQGQPGPALTYYRLATAYNDTLRSAEQHRQLLQTEARYQSREQQTQIQHLGQLTTQQTRQLWALGLGLLLTTGLLAGNVVQYRALRQANGQLQARNAQVREQASRLTLLLKELHHRVKNNLAIISSLLYMQASRLQDNRAAQAVREGQQRVDAMSLIHQRLYQTDLITAIDLPRYVAELTEGLLAAYGFDPAEFDLRLHVTQPTLDVEVAIPLGLILNEILTNACKHAYQHVARPLLAITLGPDAAGELVLEVRDNGPGFEADGPPTGSFGQQLIQVLSEQLGAALTVDTRFGTCYQLRIPPPTR